MESAEVDAYDEADERLLTTVASSMGVALENARLFGQTKRLLAETDARAKELAVVNEVQRGLAEQLEMKAMYDLVGDKLSDIFGVSFRRHLRRTGGRRSPIARSRPMSFAIVFLVERGVRLPNITSRTSAFGGTWSRPASRCSSHTTLRPVAGLLGQDDPCRTGRPASAVFAPLVVAGEVRGTVSLQSLVGNTPSTTPTCGF